MKPTFPPTEVPSVTSVLSPIYWGKVSYVNILCLSHVLLYSHIHHIYPVITPPVLYNVISERSLQFLPLSTQAWILKQHPQCLFFRQVIIQHHLQPQSLLDFAYPFFNQHPPPPCTLSLLSTPSHLLPFSPIIHSHT